MTASTSASASNNESVLSDAELARAMQAELNGGSTAVPPDTSASAAISSLDMDEECARRVEQMLRDEQLALEMQRMQSQRPGFGGGGMMVSQRATEVILTDVPDENTPADNKRCTPAKIASWCFFIPLSIVGFVAVFVLGFKKYGASDALSWIPGVQDIPSIFIPDNFQNDDLFTWKTHKRDSGLHLDIVNALTENWYPFFEQAVLDWDHGDPDSLNLTTSLSRPDSFCSPITGKMKVCNGYYGKTDWKGINELVYRNGNIVSSIAKMNDEYMDYSTDGERQYLMCHEMGHGFGLPHSDENFYNEDLGNCMDYTNTPENNQKPDVTNYELLFEMYGAMDTNRSLLSQYKNFSQYNETNDTIEKCNERERHLGRRAHEREWKVWDRSKRHVSYETDLGDGFIKRVTVILAATR